jgi:hypothetical protein
MPSGPFGVGMFDDINDTDARAKATEAGVEWVRLVASWASSNIDDMVWNAIRAGLQPVIVLGWSPQWAVENMPMYDHDGNSDTPEIHSNCGPLDREDLHAFGNAVRALVERYDADGVDDAPGSPVVKYWEFWNEPDQISGADWVGGCWGGDRDNDSTPDSQEYVDMLSYAYPAVKAANPEAYVLLGALAWEDSQGLFNTNFLDEVLSYGGDQYFDITNIHKYDFKRDDWDGWEKGQAHNDNLPWNQGILGKVAAAREKVDKPIAVSEIGKARGKMGDEKHAMHLVHELVRGLSLWPNDLKFMIWFLLVDESPPNPTGDFGLLEYGTLHEFPAYWAYKALTSELGDMEAFDYQLGPDPDPDGSTGSPYVQAFRFLMKDGGKKLVLWTDDGRSLEHASDVHVQMAIGKDELGESWADMMRLRVVDSTSPSYPPREWIAEDGNTGDLDGVADGQITLEITWDPIYVELVR